MAAYYNEIDKPTAQWLKELIRAGLIADGEVDDRDMWDVVPAELMGFDQWHFCAGIGGWSAALRLAGWPDDRPVCTISLPCQPFSAAGKGGGLADERGQLANAFFWINSILRFDTILGEQVEAALRHDWLDVMAVSLEQQGYAVGAVGFPACSVGAPHIRQRLYWVADASCGRKLRKARNSFEQEEKEWTCSYKTWNYGRNDVFENGTGPTNGFWSDAEWLQCRDGKARPFESGAFPLVDGLSERMVHRSNQCAQNAQIDPQNTAEARVMRLRGYGNAIVVTQAAAFIESFLSL